ncbi:hypothetical protein U729_3259 (plasmid) [Clostridium baratii str. Sullivan]|uniref:Uncharacterized protein n=1 Tax=Clostridium baratii str. Sullivan TaxID=1415775 RepID=A0A0A7G0D0_9CLOT|nr:hypothetical protein [Clostridium baratii]AIY85288.1 hypothetical protein U729_3259 [Clostridium baratii str. Sullivan]
MSNIALYGRVNSVKNIQVNDNNDGVCISFKVDIIKSINISKIGRVEISDSIDCIAKDHIAISIDNRYNYSSEYDNDVVFFYGSYNEDTNTLKVDGSAYLSEDELDDELIEDIEDDKPRKKVSDSISKAMGKYVAYCVNLNIL